MSAAKALAALLPEELEPKTNEQPTEPSIDVYDLQPGASPVLHRAREGAEAASDGELPSAQHPTSSSVHMFNHDSADGESVFIGMWRPPDPGQPGLGVQWVVHRTEESETAERWRTELSAGRLPLGTENGP